MKRNNDNFILGLVLGFFSAPSFSARAESKEIGKIATARTFAREKPNFLSKTLFELQYETRVELIEQRGDWVKINAKQKVGWIPSSALRKSKSVIYDVGGRESTDSGLYENEVTTAGKGFSPEYEEMTKAKDAQLNYRAVDEIEKISFTPEQLQKFSLSVGLKSELLK